MARGERKGQIVSYFKKNPDTTIPVVEIMEAFPEYDRRQIQQSIWWIIHQKVLPGLAKVSDGIYKYYPDGEVPEPEEPPQEEQSSEYVTLRVLQHHQDFLVLLDEDTNEIYKLVKAKF